MRALRLALPVLVLAACGGGSEPTSPPPPPGSTTPAALTIAAGNQQSAAPGEVVTEAPTVLVKDRNGQAVAGVQVTFAVETGGGSITGETAVTGSDGTARVGSWRLGPLPGENRLRASSGSLAPVSVTATGRLLISTTTVGGTVTLPPGTHLELGQLRVESALTGVPVGSNGAFTTLGQPGKTQFAAVHAPNGEAILLGWLDDSHHAFSARGTAEVMTFFDLRAYLQTSEAQRVIRDYLAGPADLRELEAAISAALAADPATVTLATNGIRAARRVVVQRLFAPTPGPARGTTVDPVNTPFSGISLDQSGYNSILLTNNWRRRVVGFVDRVSYVPAAGGAQVASPLPGEPINLAGVTAAATIVGTFVDISAGKYAWVPVVGPPVQAPLVPANARSTRYRVLVVGPGQFSGVVLSEKQAHALLEAGEFTLILDIILPWIDLVVTAGGHTGILGNQGAEKLVRGFFDANPAPTEIVEAIHGGHWHEAVAGAEKLLFETEVGQEFLLKNLFEPFAVSWGANGASLSAKFRTWQKALFVVDAVATAVAITQVYTALQDASQVVTWDVTASPANIALNPIQSRISQLDVQELKAEVLEANGGPAPQFFYRWSTPGNFGELCAAQATPSCGKVLETPSEKATYAPTGVTEGTDPVRVEVFVVEQGNKIPIGEASAQVTRFNTTVTVTIAPGQTTLRGGEQQTFTVQVPSSAVGSATLSYRWTTSGDFGSLTGGLKTVTTTTPQIVYTAARLHTMGEDNMAVEVLATKNGQTTSLGTDHAQVRIDRAPFTLTPANVIASKDTTVRFIARPNGDVPDHPKYVWNFGDHSPTASSTDSIITHPFTGEGTYLVGVELQDATTSRRLAVTGSTVKISGPVHIDPNPATTTVNTQLVLTASGLAPGSLRYWWDFGDGKTLRIDGANTAGHSWSEEGDYTVTVLVENAAGDDLARATGQVTVEESDAPVWRITQVTLESLSGDIPHDSMSRHPNFAAYGTYFREKQALSDIDAGRKAAYVHALSGAVMPDCFDFDGDNNKTETIPWPAMIWIQFPSLISSACEGDDVLGHSPFYPSWDLGFDQSAYFRQFQNADIRFDYPAPLFAAVSVNPGSGSLSGRGVSEWVCCSPIPGAPGASLANVYAVHEVVATITGPTLSGQITLIYTLPPASGVPRRTWTAVYSFEAEQGR